MIEHRYLSCTLTETGRCRGCRNGESPFDCMYSALAICSVCGGAEGSLLPECPGRWLTMDEHNENYLHFCNRTGPFAKEAK